MWAALARVFNCVRCGGYDEVPIADEEEPQGQGQGQGQGVREVVKVLLGDGRVLEFPHGTRCRELLAPHPHTRLFPAAVLVGRPGKMVPEEGVLEGGRMYALLPMPSSTARMRVAFTAPKEYLALLRGEDDYSSGSEQLLFWERAAAPAAAPHRITDSSPQDLSRLRTQGQLQGQSEEKVAELPQEPVMKRGPSRVHNWSGPLQSISELDE